MVKWTRMTADDLRAERNWRQRGLAAATIGPKQVNRVDEEVREIDDELSARGERRW